MIAFASNQQELFDIDPKEPTRKQFHKRRLAIKRAWTEKDRRRRWQGPTLALKPVKLEVDVEDLD